MADSSAGRLAGRVAIVTGGASGFGAGIAERFVAEGALVVIADRDANAGAEAATQLGALAIECDVADPASVDALVAATLAAHGRLDVLVNNAGVGHPPQPLDQLAVETFDRIVAVNIRAVYLTARAALPALRETKGNIINIASTGAASPRPGLAWYNASKGWIVSATRAMAIELAPAGVRVNAINPVAGETPLLATFMGGDTPETRARFLSTIPLGRFTTPADIAAAAAFLASDDAAMITGTALGVDGGRGI